MTVKEFLKKTYKRTPFVLVRPHAICNDGYEISIQASRCHYCFPKKSLQYCNYTSVEVYVYGELNKKDLNAFIKNSSGYEEGTSLFHELDINFLNHYLEEKHGGIAEVENV